MNNSPIAPSGTNPSRGPAPWAYLWWAAVGAGAGIGVIGILTIGALFLAGTLVLVVIGVAWGPLRNTSVIATVGGLAAAPLYLAWLNREGPGTVCESTHDVRHCVERWSPWPFLIVGLVLLAASV